MTQIRARVNDDTLAEWLDDRENKSETVREALRYLRLKEEGVGDERLTDAQRAAYQWFRERVGIGESIALGPAKSKIAAQVGIEKADLRFAVFEPLNRLGYIDVTPRMHDVVLTVRSPEDAIETAESATAVDEPEKAGDRLDALTAAGEEVAESAD